MGHSSPRKEPNGSQPRGAIASVAGERIYYREAGEGSPVVLIHGFPGNTFVWSRLMPRFVDHHRVIALDLPGLGYSHRDRNRSFALESVGATVIGLMGELGVDHAAVFGNSMGGGVAEWMAATFPARVDRLVLLAAIDEEEGSAWSGGWTDLAETVAVGVAVQIPALARAVTRDTLRGMVERPELVTPAMVEGYVRPLLRRGSGLCLLRYELDNRRARRLDFSRIQSPTLVISGERDASVGPETGARIASRIDGARYVVLPDAKHSMVYERADDVFAEAERFLHPQEGLASQ